MPVGCSIRRRLAALFGVCLLLAWSIDGGIGIVRADQGPCTGAPLQTGDVVNIAVLAFIADVPLGRVDGDYTATTPAKGTFGKFYEQGHLLATKLYFDLFDQRNDTMLLASGATITINHVVINMGDPRYADTTVDFSTAVSYPDWTIAATAPGFPHSACRPGGLFEQLTSQNRTLLKEVFDIDGVFTFIVPTPSLLEDAIVCLSNLIEDAQTAIVSSPLLAGDQLFKCDGILADPAKGIVSTTPDCLSPQYNRSRLQGTRRWNTVFTALSDSTAMPYTTVAHMHTLGVETFVFFQDAVTYSTNTELQVASALNTAANLGMRVIEVILSEIDPTCNLKVAAGRNPRCPPLDIPLAQNQVFPGGLTPRQMALQLAAWDADALFFIGIGLSGSSWIWARLLDEMKAIDYTPRAILMLGGFKTAFALDISSPAIIDGTIDTAIWTPRFTGVDYRNIASRTNFELLPATDDMDAPQVMVDAIMRKFGPGRTVTTTTTTAVDERRDASEGAANHRLLASTAAHPWLDPQFRTSIAQSQFVAFTWHALLQVQKMIETAQTDHVPTILSKTSAISTPGVFRRIQFDPYGRTASLENVITQTFGSTASLLEPYNIADRKAIYPLPTWEERVFAPRFYTHASERVIVAVTAVALAICLATAVVVWACRDNPVIRATTPSFCMIIILGAMSMLTSNFFATLTLNDQHCAASVWLLTLGFTCVFASLFLRSARIWRIFRMASLKPTRLQEWHILLGVAAFLLSDVIINAAWQGTGGMKTELIQPDSYRPSKNYYVCDFGSSLAAVWVHLAIKGSLMLVGMALTWALRHAPSRFNESTPLGLAIYNTSFLACFILPIVALGLGGRESTMLIRAFAIIFCALTTLLLLFAPKIRFILTIASKGGQALNKGGVGVRPAGSLQVGKANLTHLTQSHGVSLQLARLSTMHLRHAGAGAGGLALADTGIGAAVANNAYAHGGGVGDAVQSAKACASYYQPLGASAIPGHLPASLLGRISSLQLQGQTPEMGTGEHHEHYYYQQQQPPHVSTIPLPKFEKIPEEKTIENLVREVHSWCSWTLVPLLDPSASSSAPSLDHRISALRGVLDQFASSRSPTGGGGVPLQPPSDQRQEAPMSPPHVGQPPGGASTMAMDASAFSDLHSSRQSPSPPIPMAASMTAKGESANAE